MSQTPNYSLSKATIELPAIAAPPLKVTLTYVMEAERNRVPPPPFAFLHLVRSGTLTKLGPRVFADHAAKYYRALDRIVRLVQDWSESHRFRVALSAPSSRHDAEPYLAAVMSRQDDPYDLSSYFQKRNGHRAGAAGAFSETVDAIDCRLKSVRHVDEVLIVDDIVSRGFTAGALVHHLRQHGLPPAAHVTVFAPVWMSK